MLNKHLATHLVFFSMSADRIVLDLLFFSFFRHLSTWEWPHSFQWHLDLLNEFLKSIIYAAQQSTPKFSGFIYLPFHLPAMLWLSSAHLQAGLSWSLLSSLMWWQSAGGSAGTGWSKRVSRPLSPLWLFTVKETSLLGENGNIFF